MTMTTLPARSTSRMTRRGIVAADCAEALATTGELWTELAGRRVFVAGEIGGAMAWVLELLLAAIDVRSFGCEVVVLVSDSGRFAAGPAGHLATHPALSLWSGEGTSFDFPEGTFHSVIYFAADPECAGPATPGAREVAEYLLRFASCARVSRFLFVRPGPVCGRELRSWALPESHTAESSDLDLAAMRDLRAAEDLVLATARGSRTLGAAVARCFPAIGPYLKFSPAGSWQDLVGAAAARRAIVLPADAGAVISLMYGADMAVWLWTLLLRAPDNIVWNVGSDAPVSLQTIVDLVAEVANPMAPLPVCAAPAAKIAPAWLVPDTMKASAVLGLRQTVPLVQAIRRTLLWESSRQ